MGVIFWIKINSSPTFVCFRSWDVGFRVLFPSRPTARDSESAGQIYDHYTEPSQVFEVFLIHHLPRCTHLL